MYKFSISLLAATSLVACGADSAHNSAPNGALEFLNPELAIIRGTKIDPSKVKPVVIYTTNSGGGCTGTFVSADTFLTAAHCITNGTGKGKRYDGIQVVFSECVHNPRYRGNGSADHALCKVTQGQLTEAIAAVVETDASKIKVSDVVRQVGGGCSVWGGSGFGVMQWALEKVIGTPSGSDRDITTDGAPGSETPGAPCSGDSGGALFATVRDALGKITDTLGNYLGTTSRSDTVRRGFFSSMNAEDQAWARASGRPVCGISDSATQCQGSEPGPQPTPPGPTPTPPGPTPGPTPPAPQVDPHTCRAAVASLESKLFGRQRADATADLAYLARCNAFQGQLSATEVAE